MLRSNLTRAKVEYDAWSKSWCTVAALFQLFGVADDHDLIKHEVDDEDDDEEELSPLSSESRRSSRLSSRYGSRTTRGDRGLTYFFFGNVSLAVKQKYFRKWNQEFWCRTV